MRAFEPVKPVGAEQDEMDQQRQNKQENEQRDQRPARIEKQPYTPHDGFPYVSIDLMVFMLSSKVDA